MWHCSLVLLTVVKPDTEENFFLFVSFKPMLYPARTTCTDHF